MHPKANGPFVSRRQPMSRRSFVRATGVAMALPFLDSMVAPFARATPATFTSAQEAAPRRLFAICNKTASTDTDTPSKREARDTVFQERYQALSKKYLKELRNQALIEIR